MLVVYVYTKVRLKLLVLLFYLAVCLGVEGRTKIVDYLKVVVYIRLELASKDRTAI